MILELNRQELKILLAWSEQATRGKFDLGDDTVGLTWEEETLCKKLKEALKSPRKR